MSEDQIRTRIREAFSRGYRPAGPEAGDTLLRDARTLAHGARPRAPYRLASVLAVVVAVAVVVALIWTQAGRALPIGPHRGRPAVSPPLATPTPAPPTTPSGVVPFDQWESDPAGQGVIQRVDWQGRQLGPAWRFPKPDPATIGSQPVQGIDAVSPDGRLAWLSTTLGTKVVDLSLEDATGARVASADPADAGFVWADDSAHMCDVDASGTTASLRIGTIARGTVSWRAIPVPGLAAGDQPRVVACAVAGDRVIIMGGPPVQVISMRPSDGHLLGRWSLTNKGALRASGDGRFIAGVEYAGNGQTTIYDAATGKVLAGFSGSVAGFSGDGTRVVVDSHFFQNAADLGTTSVIEWSTGKQVWSSPGWADPSVRSDRGSSALAFDLIRTVPNPDSELGGPRDLVLVGPSGGTTATIPNAGIY